jgi:hypothetical protein
MTSPKNFYRRYGFSLFVVAIIIFRFLYSLSQEFWNPLDIDTIQIYLIGLKSFTTHAYPYFGADVVYNASQIPGALQGYLVSAGWYLLLIPEAPYIVMNILLTLSLGFLAWYSSKRLPDLSRTFIWIYIFLIPWSICYFTRIINPSYVIPGAILFFIGIFEIYPSTRKNVLPEWLCFYFLGFSIFWIMQLHLSWILLVPFTVIAFYYLLRSKNTKRILQSSISFLFGCITTASLLIPTLRTYGMSNDHGKSVSGLLEFHPEHITEFIKLLGIYLGYACFDLNRFRPLNAPDSGRFGDLFPWAIPFMYIILATGLLQALWLLFCFFRKYKNDKVSRRVADLTIFGFAIFFISSLFSLTIPLSHAAVLFFPLVVIYALHVFREPMKKKWIKMWLYSAFASAMIFYLANGIDRYNTISIYKNREAIVKALEQGDYTLVGKRRYEQ